MDIRLVISLACLLVAAALAALVASLWHARRY